VLVDTERLCVEVDALVLGQMGWPLTVDEVVDRFVGRPDEYTTAELARHLGRELPSDWDLPFRHLYRDALEKLQPVPGIANALDRINQPVCVASSGTHERMRLTLGRAGLYGRFAGRIFSTTEVTNGKPAPDLFLHAAKQMNANPRKCAVIEDSVPGVEAAQAAGMTAFGYAGSVTPRTRLEAAGAVVFDDMEQLPTLLG
jgi:HAD superfamily hydrolase (TIGR01509 family)